VARMQGLPGAVTRERGPPPFLHLDEFTLSELKLRADRLVVAGGTDGAARRSLTEGTRLRSAKRVAARVGANTFGSSRVRTL
jgi:hypothetical protein